MDLALAVDVGGTKMLAALIDRSGKVRARCKCATPRGGTKEKTVRAVSDLMREAVSQAPRQARVLGAGVAFPGVVDPVTGRILVTPNMNLTGVRVGPELAARMKMPVIIGNDANLGTLGVYWREAAVNTANLVGLFIGTGIGGGIVINGRLLRGGREMAGELGHMAFEPDGPRCGCGNRGCLEALASRSAVERTIREAVARGKKTLLTGLLDGDLRVIKSGKIALALKKRDALTVRVMRQASEHIGRACLTLLHLLDPDRIMLAGGLVEACGAFMLPVIRRTVAGDRLVRNHPEKRILISRLGDDAVISGAAFLVFERADAESPGHSDAPLPILHEGKLDIGGRTYMADILFRCRSRGARPAADGGKGGKKSRTGGKR